jgi:hypothetical protein
MGQSGNGTRFPHASRVVYPPFFSNDDSPEYQLFKRYSHLILDLCDSVENEEQKVVVVKGQRVTLTTYINAVDENRSVGQSFTLGLMTLEPLQRTLVRPIPPIKPKVKPKTFPASSSCVRGSCRLRPVTPVGSTGPYATTR